MTDRLFLGIPLTPAARVTLANQLARVFPTGLPGRPVPPENWHVTVRFLGAVESSLAARLGSDLAEGALGPSFEISVRALGAFPNARRARVLWGGVDEGAAPLRDLAARVEGRVRAVGLPEETRPFSPHLTLSRLRDAEDLRTGVEAGAEVTVRFPVADLVLFRSHLGGPSPRYEVVERFPL